MAKVESKEVKAKSPYKVTLKVHSQASATIIRPDKFPQITDKTPDAVKWLAANGFKAEEIEVVGDKPSNWDEVFVPVVA